MSISRQDGLIEALPLPVRGLATAAVGASPADTLGLYEMGGVAAAIVDRIADDAVTHGFRCDGDDDEIMADEWSRLDLQSLMADAGRLAALTGAAAVFVLCEDGPDPSEPLNEARIGQVRGLLLIAGDRISAIPGRYADPNELNYGQPMRYRITPEASGDAFVVHETRLLRVPGQPMPRRIAGNGGVPWMGRPVLSGAVARALSELREGLAWIPALLQRKQNAVYAMKSLTETLLEPDGEQLIMRRLNITDTVRGVLNTVAIDSEDSYLVQDLSLSGVDTGIAELKIAVSAACGIPVSILFGQSATGMNATGENDFVGYFGRVSQAQNRGLRPAIERLTALLWMQPDFVSRTPDKWRVEFNPLRQPTEQERLAADKTQSDRLKVVAEMLAVVEGLAVSSPEELREAVKALLPELGLVGDLPPPEDLSDGFGVEPDVVDPNAEPLGVDDSSVPPDNGPLPDAATQDIVAE